MWGFMLLVAGLAWWLSDILAREDRRRGRIGGGGFDRWRCEDGNGHVGKCTVAHEFWGFRRWVSCVQSRT